MPGTNECAGYRAIVTAWCALAATALFAAALILSIAQPLRHRIPYPKTGLCCGYDWRAIDSYSISDTAQQQIKGNLIRLALESSAFAGAPMVTTGVSVAEYLRQLDAFYAKEENRFFPIYFALQEAVMANTGRGPDEILLYHARAGRKLLDAGFAQ
ncbi:MAG: hypothetical protein WCG78_02495 [Candidatus Omnitrophota bacterium]